MKFKIGDKVHTKENHSYLGITKRNVGTIHDILYRDRVEVTFKGTKYMFVAEELKKK